CLAGPSGQAPKPRSGAPQARGLTAKFGPSDHRRRRDVGCDHERAIPENRAPKWMANWPIAAVDSTGYRLPPSQSTGFRWALSREWSPPWFRQHLENSFRYVISGSLAFAFPKHT